MNQYLEQMRKYDDCVLLSIINRDRFNYKAEEVQAAIELLRERGVEFEFLSDDEVREMNSFKARIKNLYSDIKDTLHTFWILIRNAAVFIAICVVVLRLFHVTIDDIKGYFFQSHKSVSTEWKDFNMVPFRPSEEINHTLREYQTLQKSQPQDKGLIDLNREYNFDLTPGYTDEIPRSLDNLQK